MTVSLRLLGPGAWHGELITSSRTRVLLAVLAGTPSGMSTERLADEVWPDGAPANPAKAVQVLVSRARALLGPQTIERTTAGYRLAVPADEVDVRYAARLAHQAAGALAVGDSTTALAGAREGLSLWDAGPADPDIIDALAGTDLDLEATTRSLRRTRALSLASLGRNAEALPGLESVVDQSPGDDVARAAMLRAHATVVGRASALELYETHRRALRDRLGVAPSPVLTAVQSELLEDDPPVRHGIRHSPNHLLGRDADIAALRAMIGTSRVVSIVGAGGLGKTRLAQELAATATERIVHVVELAGVRSPEGVLPEIATVLGTRDTSGRLTGTQARMPSDVRAAMAEQLSAAPSLVVLDNCEHVIDVVAELVDELVAASPALRVLTTSRTPLDIHAEAVYLLPQLDASTAVALFAERARATRPDVDLPPDAVDRVCRQLDGLPLAIELAAAKVRVMGVSEVERRLDDRFALLRGSSRSAPARHQTLLAVIDWSWNLLTEPERAALRRLAAFHDGFTLPAAGVVVGDDAEAQVTSLVTQSLLAVAETPLGARYRMLETVREFARMSLVDAGEDQDADARSREWAGDYALRWGAGLLGQAQFEAMDHIRAEEVNLSHALSDAAVSGDGDRTAAIFGALATMWSIESNHFRVVRLAPQVDHLLYRWQPSPRFVQAHRGALAVLAMNTFVFNPRLASRALSRLRRLPREGTGRLELLCDLLLLLALGPFSSPEDFLARAAGYGAAGTVASNAFAAALAENGGDLEAAMRYAEAGLRAAETNATDPWSLAGCHQRMAEMCLQLGEPGRAAQHAASALPLLERLGAGPDATELHGLQVLAALQEGDVTLAERRFQRLAQSLDETTEVGRPGTVNQRMLQAELDLARGRLESGLAGYREAVARSAGTRVPDDLGAHWQGFEPWLVHTISAAVAAHAIHGRPDQIRSVASDLAARTSDAVVNDRGVFLDYPVTAAALYALGLWLLSGGDDGAGTSSPDLAILGTRLMAVGVHLGHARAYPSLGLEAGGSLARAAVGAAYDDLLSSYATWGRDRLRAEAGELLRSAFGRGVTPSGAAT